jgi:hypothetical protein
VHLSIVLRVSANEKISAEANLPEPRPIIASSTKGISRVSSFRQNFSA